MSDRTTMECYPSGCWFDFADPQPDQIDLDDIATALSNACRFGGHVPWHYSVAEHACLVRDLVRQDHPELGAAALHHDSHEAYMGDLPTPLKNALEQAGVYRPMVDAIDAAIGELFGLDPAQFHHPAIQEADLLALRMEASVVKRSKGIEGAWRWRELPDMPDGWIPGLDSTAARQHFLTAHSAEIPF